MNPNGTPSNLTPYKPGQSGNPAGRKAAGATLREHLNSLVEAELTEDEVRAIARDKKQSMNRRAAAERYLRLVEVGDLADYHNWLIGQKTLVELREAGINTEIVKKAKITDKGGRELELHDRAGTDFDRIVEQTDGRPGQTVNVIHDGLRTDSDRQAAADKIIAELLTALGGGKPGGAEGNPVPAKPDGG